MFKKALLTLFDFKSKTFKVLPVQRQIFIFALKCTDGPITVQE